MREEQRRSERRFTVLLWFYSLYALGWALVLLLLLFPFALLFVLWRQPAGGHLLYKALHHLSRAWFLVTGMKYKQMGEGEIYDRQDTTQPCVYVANHRSYIDILMMLACMEVPYRPLGKEQMARIPLFGFFYRRFVITVDRDRGGSRLRSYIDLKKMLDHKISVFIFPEGTFNESREPLARFYSGPFQLALKSGLNIKPVVFVNSLDRMHYSSIFTLRPGVCGVLFLKDIDIGGYLPDQMGALKQEVYNQMYLALTKYKDGYRKSG